MHGEIAMATGVLHDTVEDSKGKVTFQLLETIGFPSLVLDPLRLLTKTPGVKYTDELYMDMIKSIARNKTARVVKMEDLLDNMDVRRLRGIHDGMPQKDADRLSKYARAYGYLLQHGG
jgi:hypothetical protein